MMPRPAILLTSDDRAPDVAVRYDSWFATPLGRAMDVAEARAVLRLAAPQAGERALDAGCGTGIYARRLADAGLEVVGVDTDPEMIVASRLKVPEASMIEADVSALPFCDDDFDLSLAVTVLCFMERPERAVAELVRVTRPGGRVVLAELNPWSPWAAWRRIRGWGGSPNWRDARFHSWRRLAGLLSGAGAERLRAEAAGYLPPGAPGWLLARAGAYERRARLLGSLGAAFSLARGEVSRPTSI